MGHIKSASYEFEGAAKAAKQHRKQRQCLSALTT